MADAQLDQLCINTIRMLAVDMVQAANSGHPGMPLGAAPAAYAIWDRVLKHNPSDPEWPNRDRFVLSAGHASAMLYSLIHLCGYDLSMDELKRFRQLGSKCPGHPERGDTPGVEVTSGPLGQGVANAVGMALAEAHLAAIFNKPGCDLVNHHTYVICSEGDLMEGVSAEAASFAGFLGLGKLIMIYDDNGISIDGSTRAMTFNEDVGKRFEAYGWQVLEVADGNDVNALEAAVRAGRADGQRPTLIWSHSHIGYGSPLQDQAKCHGSPFSEEGHRQVREFFNWQDNPPFFLPEEALAHFRQAMENGKAAENEWNEKFEAYAKEYADEAKRFSMMMNGELPANWEKALPTFEPVDGGMATRNASGKVMNAIAKPLAGCFVGGSADLAGSNKTTLNDCGDVGPNQFEGMNVHFGVREHAMGAILNGMSCHGGIIPFGGTFLVFSDYMRPAIRVAALSNIQAIYVLTHDSIGVGEDGPTHQPIEHHAALRSIPNMVYLRPAEANETAAAWKIAIERKNGPTALGLTRQNLPILDLEKYPVAMGVPRGAYILSEADGGSPDVILMASGSEVSLIMEAQIALAAQGIKARVVSMPSWELFDAQDAAYREEVLPSSITARVAVEAGVGLGWERYTGLKGAVISCVGFGASAPYKEVFTHFGFTVENVVAKAKKVVGKCFLNHR